MAGGAADDSGTGAVDDTGTDAAGDAGSGAGGGGTDADVVRLATAVERFTRVLRRLTAPDGMSLTTVATLVRLDDLGPHRLSELAAAEGVTQPGMTQLVSRLEREGLAQRRGDPADGRVVVVEITAAGRESILRRRRERAGKLSGLLADLPAEDRAAITRSLEVLDRLAGRLSGPPAGSAG